MKAVQVEIPFEVLLEAVSRLEDDQKRLLYGWLGNHLGEHCDALPQHLAVQQLGQTVEQILTATGMTEDELVEQLWAE